MGIHNSRMLNQALLANQCWRILNNPSVLISQILLPKYCSLVDILNVKSYHIGHGKVFCMVGTSLWTNYIEPWKMENLSIFTLIGGSHTFQNPWAKSFLLPAQPPPLSKVNLITPNQASIGISPKSVISSQNPLLLWFWHPSTQYPLQGKLVWPHTPLGKYITKLGYRSLYDQQCNSSFGHPCLHNGVHVWKALWSLNLPERIKVFLWKCAKDILSVKPQLSAHLHQIPPLCPLCNTADESLEHLFIYYPVSARVWETSSIQLPS